MSSPAIGADGTIYVGSYDKNVYALTSSGDLKWSYETGSWVHSSAAIGDDGSLYIGSADGRLYAFEGPPPPAPIPEPSTLLLLCFGLIGIAVIRKKLD